MQLSEEMKSKCHVIVTFSIVTEYIILENHSPCPSIFFQYLRKFAGGSPEESCAWFSRSLRVRL